MMEAQLHEIIVGGVERITADAVQVVRDAAGTGRRRQLNRRACPLGAGPRGWCGRPQAAATIMQ